MGGALVLALAGGWPMPLLVPHVGLAISALIVWVLASIGWMIAVVPVRLFTDFPTLDEELARTGATNLADAVRIERAKLDRAATGSLPERRRRHFLFAAVGGVMAIALAIATVATLELVPGRVYLFAPIGALVSAGFAIGHTIRGALTFLER